MPGGSIPVPNDILALAEDYNAALKDVERNIRSVERDIVKTLKKEGDVTGLLAQKKELEGSRSLFKTGQQEQAFNQRVEKILERRGNRVASQFRGTGIQGDQLNGLIRLASGDVSTRNVVNSVRSIGNLASGRGRGLGSAALSVAGQELGIPALATAGGTMLAGLTALAPVAAAFMDLQRGNERAKTVFELNRRSLALGKKLGMTRDEILSGIAASDPGRVGRDMTERIALGERKFINAATLKLLIEENPDIAAAHFNALLSDAPGMMDKVRLNKVTTETIDYTIRALEAGEFGDFSKDQQQAMIEEVGNNIKNYDARNESQRKTFTANPGIARQFHREVRDAKFIEKERYHRSVRAW
jgi:hypothetical protein